MRVVDAPPGSVGDIDDRGLQVSRSVEAQNRAHYTLARLLSPIRERALWRPTYKSFGQFCRAQGVSEAFAHKLIAVLVKFSENEFIRFGARKLYDIINAPVTERAALATAMRAGASRAQLRGLAVRPQRAVESTLRPQFKVGEVQQKPAHVVLPPPHEERGHVIAAHGAPCRATFDYGPLRFIVTVRERIDGTLYVEHAVAESGVRRTGRLGVGTTKRKKR